MIENLVLEFVACEVLTTNQCWSGINFWTYHRRFSEFLFLSFFFAHTRLLLLVAYYWVLLKTFIRVWSKTLFQLVLTQVPKQTGTNNIRLVLPHVIQEWPSIWYQCGSFGISNLLQRNLLLHPSKICKMKNWHFLFWVGYPTA
jgi:hypothetical protein